LAARVLGPNEKCGIYKITNKNNKLCYIGQSKKIRERWREHMKCGLGIDTPAANKLYQAMIKEGIDNFTFELLEECSSQLLDEKETFYISLYNSYDYGYNSNRGNKKV
jgi:group I intron endonuclease